MTTKHSEGPWRYDYEPGYCGELIAEDGQSVCTFADEPKPDDAKVLAAAPELLESLTELYEALDSCVDLTPDLLQRARSAITKARGQQR